MWLVHIDTWNWADPQKIIDLVPMDIRPYVVFNISLSINHDGQTGQWLTVEYGYETAKSWLRTCAENRVWAIIQPSSGGFSHFSDFDLTVYEEFYRDYPNLIGFNYCEQFWGYDSTTDPLSARWTDRINHFANLLELSSRYGGYLVVSWCGNQWSANINPIAMLKRVPAFEAACRQFTQNYILCEKYTQQSYLYDMESLCLGSYLSGYSGQYGIRYDETGWTNADGDHADFILATGLAAHFEHIMLTGQTVIDGPELIWRECFRELSTGVTSDGYTMRRWGTFPQFDNVSAEIFRKILDGTVRIPTRKEVIDRTKVVIINDVYSGSSDDRYSSPETLFEGLYRMDGDGNLRNNHTFFKKTGRYPTVPTVYQLNDALARSFEVQVNKSAYANRWPTIASKVSEFNSLFPQEYTGDIYAGRHENGWVTYNPYKTGQTASGMIPFKYNTCDAMELTLSRYTAGVMKEYPDKVTVYLNNYDNVLDTGLKTNVITIYGSASEPAYSWNDRADHQPSIVTKDWTNGVLTLTLRHNGAIDITIHCAGTAADRLTEYTTAPVVPPVKPAVYTGPRQYEAEHFEYRNIARNVSNGINRGVSNYTGQGYLEFGTHSAARARTRVNVLQAGTYRLETKYSVIGADIDTVDLYVNGSKAASPLFTRTAALSDWGIQKQNVILNAGTNTIEFRANAAGAGSIYFDNIVLVPTAYGYGFVIQEDETGFVSVDGTIDNAYSGYTGGGYADTDDIIGASIVWNVSLDSSIVKSFTFRYACTEDRTADLIINGCTVARDICFPATEAWSAWDFITVYVSADAGVSEVSLVSTSGTGLPNIDCIEVAGGGGEIDPMPPAAVSATVISNSQVNLSWTASAAATSYNVKRAIASGGPYTTLASNITTTQFCDTTISPGTLYYYVVSANTDEGESLDSAEATPVVVSTYLKFDETGGTIAYDATGYGRHGTLVNGPLWTAGKFGNAVSLDGVNDYVSLPTGVVSGLTDFTIATWVYLNRVDTWTRVFDFGTGTGVNMFLTPRSGSETVRFAITTGGAGGEQQINGIAALPMGIWTHVAVTLDGTTGVLYVNGVEVGRNDAMSLTPAALGATTQNYIGRSQYAADPYLNGYIDEFRIYADALSADQIASLYAEQIPAFVPTVPTDLNAVESTGGRVELTWTASADVTNYNVKRSTVDGGPYTHIAALSGTSFTDTDLSQWTMYYYVVSAVNSAGESINSMQASVFVQGFPPAAPSGLTAEAGDGMIVLAWNANTESGLAGYNVYRSTSPTGEYTLLNRSLLNSPGYVDNDVITYTTYYYVVTAVDIADRESDGSDPVSATPIDGRAVMLNGVDFEAGFGDWVNITDHDTHDWLRHSGSTPTPMTGPAGGADGSTWYVYMRTSLGYANTAGDNAILESPVIYGFGRILTFYYHMYGVHIGTLNVDVYDGTWHYGIWSVSGQQHTSAAQPYTQALVNLSDFSGPIQIRFRAVAVGGGFGDIAIDQIEVLGRVLYGDMNGDGVVDIDDLAGFADYWLQENGELDLDNNGRIDLCEFAAFSENWLKKPFD
jgi:fibronectin type 3 domain-containing protein